MREVPKFHEIGDGKYAATMEKDPVRIGGEDRPALEPMLLYLHARGYEKEGRDVDYLVSHDGRKVNVVWDEEYQGRDSEWRLGYSAAKMDDETSIIRMVFRPVESPSETPGSKPWKDIIWTLEDRTEKYYKQLEQKKEQ